MVVKEDELSVWLRTRCVCTCVLAYVYAHVCVSTSLPNGCIWFFLDEVPSFSLDSEQHLTFACSRGSSLVAMLVRNVWLKQLFFFF